MNIIKLFLAVTMLCPVAYGQSSPFFSPTQNIGQLIANGHEPSGATWDKELNRLYVVSNGGANQLIRMGLHGTNLELRNLTNLGIVENNPDVEGVAIVNEGQEILFLGIERGPGDPATCSTATPCQRRILKYDFKNSRAMRVWRLPELDVGASNAGLEGITYVADSLNCDKGWLYVALQANGKIYAYRYDKVMDTLTYQTTASINTYANDISELSYKRYANGLDVLFVLYDGRAKLRTYHKTNPMGQFTYFGEWSVPNSPTGKSEQEAFTIAGCNAVLGYDDENSNPIGYYLRPFSYPPLADGTFEAPVC